MTPRPGHEQSGTKRSTTKPSVRRWLRLVFALTCVAATSSLLVGCGGSDDTAGVLDQIAPTRQDVADQAGIEFPESTKGFRLVRTSDNQIDVTFTIDPTDVDTYAAGSGFEFTDGARVIVHASPIWDVAVTDPLRGATSSINGIERRSEIVDTGTTSTVRLSLLLA